MLVSYPRPLPQTKLDLRGADRYTMREPDGRLHGTVSARTAVIHVASDCILEVVGTPNAITYWLGDPLNITRHLAGLVVESL